MRVTAYRMFERGVVGAIGLGLIALGLRLLPYQALLGQVDISADAYAFRGSVPVFVMAIGAGLLVSLIAWGGARAESRTTEKRTDRTTTTHNKEIP